MQKILVPTIRADIIMAPFVFALLLIMWFGASRLGSWFNNPFVVELLALLNPMASHVYRSSPKKDMVIFCYAVWTAFVPVYLFVMFRTGDIGRMLRETDNRRVATVVISLGCFLFFYAWFPDIEFGNSRYDRAITVSQIMVPVTSAAFTASVYFCGLIFVVYGWDLIRKQIE
jgi:hypothetical protein